MNRHLHLDPFSGIAGDMFLGALIDLGLDLDALRQALGRLPIDQPYRITTNRVSYQGIGAVDLKVVVDDGGHEHGHGQADAHEHDHMHDHAHAHPHEHEHKHEHIDERERVHEHQHKHDHEHGEAHSHDHDHSHSHSHSHSPGYDHHHTGYREIMAMVEQLDTTPRGRRRAGAVVTALAEAEARVHGKSLEEIHFHEVGAVDSIVDMLGGVVALELLEVDSLSCGVLPISSGFVRCDHGLMPVPAPATAYLMEGLPTLGVDRRGELITPTGAAMVKALCGSFGPPPAMTLEAVGYGAGDRQTPEVPNLLRVFLGTLHRPGEHAPLQRQTPVETGRNEGESSHEHKPAHAHAHGHSHGDHGHHHNPHDHDHDHDQGHGQDHDPGEHHHDEPKSAHSHSHPHPHPQSQQSLTSPASGSAG